MSHRASKLDGLNILRYLWMLFQLRELCRVKRIGLFSWPSESSYVLEDGQFPDWRKCQSGHLSSTCWKRYRYTNLLVQMALLIVLWHFHWRTKQPLPVWARACTFRIKRQAEVAVKFILTDVNVQMSPCKSYGCGLGPVTGCCVGQLRD
jgi:hypothetical protein